MTGPLAGLLVIDLSRVLAGPLATMLLGDMGADVIKVERPGTGDDTRGWGPPFVHGHAVSESTYFLAANRNKRSIEIDFKKPDDLATLRRLIAAADVLVENFRPEVMTRLGLAPEALSKLNPRLVTLCISGFGSQGPESDRAGYDQILQGEAGIMSMTGPSPDRATKVGVPIGDVMAGMLGALGVVSALHERVTSGHGQVVRTSLLAALINAHTFQATRWLLGGEIPVGEGNHHPTVCPYGAFPCADGVIQVAVGSNPLWARFAAHVGVAPDDSRFATNADRLVNREALHDLIEKSFALRSATDLLNTFRADGIPAGAIRTLDEVYSNPQVIDQGLLISVEHPELGNIRLPGPPLSFSRTQRESHCPPPKLGEHTEEILEWLSNRAAR